LFDLQSNTQISALTINLEKNALEDKHLNSIGQALKHQLSVFTKLQDIILDLSENKITNEGAELEKFFELFLTSLETPESLRITINLSSNELSRDALNVFVFAYVNADLKKSIKIKIETLNFF